MPSESSCTYDDYARDISQSPDISAWYPSVLPDNISNSIFGFAKGVASISDDIPVKDKFLDPINLMSIDEYTFEILVPIPPVCWDTVRYLTNSRNNDMVICMSNSLQRNIVFAVQGCVLCVRENKATLYIPSTLKKTAYKDMTLSGIECSRSGIFTGHSHHRVLVPPMLLHAAKRLFNESHHIHVSKDHRPMADDGYTTFCKVTPVICIKAKSQKLNQINIGNEPVEQISERKIVVKVLQFLECVMYDKMAQQ